MYENGNENDYAITEVKPEQALRVPRLTNHQSITAVCRETSPTFAKRSYPFTASGTRFTYTSTRTIMPSRAQNPSRRSGFPGSPINHGGLRRNQPYLLSRRAQTGMSVLQSAAHEKTAHCPLPTGTASRAARLAGLSGLNLLICNILRRFSKHPARKVFSVFRAGVPVRRLFL